MRPTYYHLLSIYDLVGSEKNQSTESIDWTASFKHTSWSPVRRTNIHFLSIYDLVGSEKIKALRVLMGQPHLSPVRLTYYRLLYIYDLLGSEKNPPFSSIDNSKAVNPQPATNLLS